MDDCVLGHMCSQTDWTTRQGYMIARGFEQALRRSAAHYRAGTGQVPLGRLYSLERCWGVPMQALIERVHRLGTLSAQQRTGLKKLIADADPSPQIILFCLKL